MSGADRFNVNLSFSRNWEHLHRKFVGTGNPDTTRFEWQQNVHRDRIASRLGHVDQLVFFATAEGESVGRIKHNLKERMLLPCSGQVVETRDEAGKKGGK